MVPVAAVSLRRVPVVVAAPTIEVTIPVVVPDEVINAIVPAVEAVDDRFKRFPDVVPVSTDVDERFNKEPPEAMTAVVWAILIPFPVVSPLRVTSTAAPVVKVL